MGKDKYSHRERIELIAAGETPDRAAASIWRHFFHREATVDGLVEAMLSFQKEFDWDFMKINPRATFHVEDWGVKLDWSTDEFVKHKYTEFTIKELSDWDKIEVLPMEAPVLADHLKAISLIKKASDPELPLLMTIFNPLGIARYMSGSKEKILEHLKQDPERVKRALENITVTFENFVKESRNAGADGMFYATLEWASADAIPYARYNELCRPLDLRILNASGEDAMNILHVCAGNNYLKELTDYPVRFINWEAADPTNMNLDEAIEYFDGKVAVGGVDHKGWLWHSAPEEVGYEIKRMKERMTGKKFIFGSGCTIDARVPFENLRAVRENL